MRGSRFVSSALLSAALVGGAALFSGHAWAAKPADTATPPGQAKKVEPAPIVTTVTAPAPVPALAPVTVPAPAVTIQISSSLNFDPFSIQLPATKDLTSKALVVQSPLVVITPSIPGNGNGGANANSNGQGNGIGNGNPNPGVAKGPPGGPPAPPPPRSSWKPGQHLHKP